MSFIDTKLIPVSQRIADNKYIKCLAGGSMSLMAIILIGAVFNLLNSIGFEWYQNFIQGIGINYLFNLIYNACMNLMSVFIVYSVGFNSAKIFGHEELAFNNGFLAEVAFFILMPIGSYTAEGAFGATNFYAIDYLGSHGVFLALITGIVVTKINIFIVEKKITIKMPAGVPQNVLGFLYSFDSRHSHRIPVRHYQLVVYHDSLGQCGRCDLWPAPDPTVRTDRLLCPLL